MNVELNYLELHRVIGDRLYNLRHILANTTDYQEYHNESIEELKRLLDGLKIGPKAQ